VEQVGSDNKPKGTLRTRVLVAAAACVLALIGIAIPVLAEISPNGEITWGVYGLDDSTETDSIDSQVFAIEQIGDTIYVGGKFLEAKASSTAIGVDQPYLAAFDAESGDLKAEFRPQMESAVYSLQASPDGSRLFVGGEFRSIGADARAHGLAAIDPETGAVDTTWQAKVTNTSGARPIVYGLTEHNGQLYASGRFNQVGGGARPLHSTENVTRVSIADGTADTSLSTDVDGGSVWGIAVAPDGSKIYLAGQHDAVDGNSAGADYAVLDANGRLIPSFSDHKGNSRNVNRWYGQDVVAVGDLVFWGGSEHVVRVFSATDGSLIREHSTDRGGDYQDLEVVGDRVYGSCHCYTNHYADFNWWNRRLRIPEDVLVSPIKYVAAYSAITGEYLPSFSLDMSAIKAGVWAIHGATDGCLWVGGDVSRITTVAGRDRAAGGFARFCEGNGGDSRAPETPPNLIQTRSETSKVVIRWDRAEDNLGVDHYEVSRDGVIIDTVSGGGKSRYWFTDSGLARATFYQYQVVAEDAAGNRSVAAVIRAGTAGAVDADVDGPTQPVELTQTRSEDTKAVIRWGASTDNVGIDHYEISVDGAVVGTKAASAATRYWFTTTGLAPAGSYAFSVVAIDEAGNRSVAAELDVTTTGAVEVGDDEAPTTPADLTATFTDTTKIVIRWGASTDNVGVDHYEISIDDAVVGTKPASRATRYWFTSSGLARATNFQFDVVAIDAKGNRSAAATITAGTTGAPGEQPPAPPTELTSTIQTRDRIVLRWTVSPDAASYVIQRDDGAGFVDIGTKGSRWFTDHSVAADTTYTYRVVAVDGAGVASEPSNEITVASLP